MATFRGQDGGVFIRIGTDNNTGGLPAKGAGPDPTARLKPDADADMDGPSGTEVDAVAEVMSWSLTLPREKLDVSVMGDASKRYRLGMKDWSGTIGCRLDGGDRRQRSLINQALANNPQAFTFVFYVNRDGSGNTSLTNPVDAAKYFRGDGYVELSNVSAELSSIDDVEFNIIPAGDLTIEWA